MVVSEDDVINIMGGMEHAGGIKLNDHKRKLKNRFEICRKLGQGTYGKVQLGINRETGQQVAIKTIKKSKIETEADLIRIRREIQIMSSVQHPNIIHIYEVFENKEKMVLVMEIAAGGELYDYLSERKCLEENEAKRIFRQIATAVYYCHKNNICHRDLKLENILLDENGNAKIADFGLSNVYDGKNLLTTFCGSPLYASPEIVRGSPYAGPEVDCWSLGVLLYTLVYGAMPFDGSNFKRLVKQITTGDYYEPKQPSAASSLIRTMLTVRSEKRANIGDICSHWWVNDGYPETCLEEAEFLASLTPVRLDLLLSLAPGNNESKSEPVDMRPEESVQDPSMSGVSSNEPAMSIVELPLGAEAEVAGSTTESRISISEPPDEENSQHVRRREKEKVKRKLTETPSMLDPDLVHKKRESDGTGDAMLKHDEIPVPMEEEPSTRRGTSQSPVPGGKTVRIRKKKEEPTVERLGVEETHPGYPQISPDLPRKPPPKPKMKEPEISSENQAEMKRRNSRKERNVKTPDPYHHIVPKEEQRPMTPRTHANERPMTPRQGRAPSPEERPLVVPLPPPRVEQITLPPPRPPPRSESPAPPLPPRPKMEQEEGPPKLIVVPLPPPMIVREPPQQMEVVLDDRRKSKFYPDDSSNQHDEPTHIEPVEVKRNLEAPLEDKSPIVIHSNQPPPLPEKKKTKSPQMPRSEKQSQSVQMPSGLEQSEISNHDKPNVAGSAESIEPSIQNQQKLNTRPKILSESQENKFENKIRKSPSKEKEVQPTILFETNKESAPKTPPAKPKDMTSQKYPIEIREEETNLKCKDEPTNYQETLLPPLPQLIGKVTIESNHVPNVMVSLPPISNNAGLLIEQTSKEAKNQSFKEDIKELPKPLLVNQLEQSTIESNTNHLGDLRIGHTATTHEAKVTTPSTNETSKNISQEVDIKNSSYFHEPASVKEQSKPSYIESKSEIEKPMKINEQLHIITSIPSISAEVRSSSPLVKEVALMSPKENSTSKEDIGSPKKDEVNCRSLINSVPKPFKAESPPTNEGNNDSLQREHQSESVRSCSSLSSSGSNQSLSRRPSLQQQNSQQDDLSLISPGSCSLPRPEKRDSKVIKAAQYWNNYIGEVLVKNKPPENPKSLEKPKKIVSAGVGPKGYSDLKNTFEQGGLQRRNSKKLTVDSCLPGLRVTDAKSAFEKKNQPPTPVIYRKNSVVSDNKEKPKWVRPVKVENEQEFPFINKPSDDLKSRAKAKILSEKDTLSDKTFVNGVTNNKDDILKINGSFDRSNENDLNSNELSKQKIKDHNIVIKVQSSNQTPKLNDTTETQQNNVHPKSPKTKAKVLTVKAQETLPIHPTQADSMISQPSVTHRDIQEGKDGSKIETLSTESTKTSKPLELTSKQPDINKKSLTISTKPVTEIENKMIEDAAKKTQTPVLIKEPHTFVTKPVQKEETVKKLKSGLVVIVNNKVRSQPVVINNNLNVVNPGSSSPKAIAKPTIDPKSPPTPPKIIQKAFDPEPTKEESKKSFEAIPKSKEDNKQAIDNVSEGQNNVPVKLKEELVISGKAETPEPSNPIEAAKNALKKVPHAPAMRRKSLESSPVADTGNEETQKDNKTNESLHTPVPTAVPATPINDLTSPPIKTVTSIPLQVEPLASHGERVIPIKIEPDSRSRENPSSKREHYIPIVVEGRGTILKTPEPSYIPHEDQEEAERFDTFTTDSLSRRRWGSRKKRFSSAYSDSASVSTEEDLNNESAFAGLQKYTSIGKHGMEEAPMFRLRKTRPPFALQREESFSSGEEDVFNDDGFREMTAENLFSTLLTRVKSLTRRIHDEHEDNPALRWQQNKRIINHPLNPGGTHARLERSALRSSLKRSGPPSSAASTAPSLSRQSSSDASRLSSYARSEDPRASYDDMGSQYRGIPSDVENKYNEAVTGSGIRDNSKINDEYEDSRISVTSKQRLRPGYLPPPHLTSSTHQTHNTYNQPTQTSSVSSRTFDTSVPAGSDKGSGGGGGIERTIHINVQPQRQELPVSASSSTSSISSKPPGVYHRPIKPYIPSSSSLPSGDIDLETKERRVSRFLRPDFYETSKEDSIYVKKDLENPDERSTPRFVKVVHERNESFDGFDYPVEAIAPPAPFEDKPLTAEGSGASYLSQQPITSRSSNTAHTSKRPLDNRKLSYELRSNEMDIINKLKREAAERSNDYLGDIDGEFDAMDEMGERLLRKRSGYLSRLDEDDTLLSPSRHLTRRSISRELFGGGGGGSDIDRTSSILSGSSSISGSRPVTRRSISRELFDYSPAGNVSSTGRITPTLGLGTSPARRSTVDYSRSSRERSLGRETSGLSNDFDRSNLDRNRSLGSRRSESLTRGGGNSGLSSGLSTTSSTTTSRPSLSTQGRSLTQNEFIRTSPRSSVSGRLSAGLDEDSSKIRSSALTDRGSALNDRGRADWRRVSVPERGKDYTTLQSKYKRLDPSKHSYQ